MTSLLRKLTPEYRNISFVDIITKYRMPIAAYISILHRISGALLFFFLPFLLFLFDKSLTSELIFNAFIAALSNIAIRLAITVILWSFIFHFCSGIRHLLMDLNHDLSTKESGKLTSIVVLSVSSILTFSVALKFSTIVF
ncbi:MAG: succinate dehydrogenase, cytochrome b556 subunit [Burkholderia sp.]|nr:succinate dehydrogenase, cytochrome b556 subunit [Burkholderia sp.]